MRAGHYHVSNRPTSPRAILHHTDPNRPNIMKGSVLHFCKSKIDDFRISASDFFHFDLGHFRYLLRPNYEPQRPQ